MLSQEANGAFALKARSRWTRSNSSAIQFEMGIANYVTHQENQQMHQDCVEKGERPCHFITEDKPPL